MAPELVAPELVATEPEPGADRRKRRLDGVPVLDFFRGGRNEKKHRFPSHTEIAAVGGEDPDPRAFCLVLST